jgi:hypothetical protein
MSEPEPLPYTKTEFTEFVEGEDDEEDEEDEVPAKVKYSVLLQEEEPEDNFFRDS